MLDWNQINIIISPPPSLFKPRNTYYVLYRLMTIDTASIISIIISIIIEAMVTTQDIE